MHDPHSYLGEPDGGTDYRFGPKRARALPPHDPGEPAPPPVWETPQQAGGLDFQSLLGYLAVLRRHTILIAVTAVGGLLAGLAMLLFEPILYPARITLEVQGFNENFMNMSSVDPQAGAGNYSANDSNIQTQIRILESQSLKRRVMRKLERELVPMRAPQSTWMARLRTRFKIGPNDPLIETRQALARAAGSVRGTAVRPTRIIQIQCESTIPDVAAMFANTLASEFIDQSLEGRLKSAQQTSRWLLNQLEETRAKLENAENRLRDHSRRSGLMFVEQDTLTASKLRQLQTDLASIQAERIARQSRYEMSRSMPPEALPDVLNDATLQDYQAQITDLRKEMAKLTMALTPAHYKVRRLEVQIAEIQSALRTAQETVLKRIESEFRTAQNQEKMLSAAYNTQSRLLVAQSDKTTEYQIIKREIDITQQLYNALLQQANQAGLAAAIPTNHIQVIDPAIPVPTPHRPLPSQRAGMGIVMGLILGCAVAIVLELNDRTVRTPGVSDYLRVPELGVIPSLEMSKGTLPLRAGRATLLELEAAGAEHSGTGERVELVTWQRKPSFYAESFRVALASIMVDRHARPQVMVLTSPAPSEGKTTVASNMAIAMTEVKRRILLIDLDLRKPRLHEVFNLPNVRGISDVLQDSTPIASYPLDTLIQPTEIPGLSVLTGGDPPDSIMAILYSPRLPELLHLLRQRFYAILIDTPPMLRFPDARIIARMAEGVILVLRSGQSDRNSAVMARQRFEEDGTRVIGAILNDWDLSSPAAKQYGGRYNYSNIDPEPNTKKSS